MPRLIDQLAPVYKKLAPELDVEAPLEPRSTCATCAMAPKEGRDPARPIAFIDPARCCTYNPWLANHVVGRILRRGDRGSDTMRARIATGVGVTSLGVGPSEEWTETYTKFGGEGFGRDPQFRCPYWVEETYGCTIWQDRNAVCRTWHCKQSGGGAGRNRWLALRDAIGHLDTSIARQLVTLGTPPSASARASEWVAWYRWCVERVDLLAAADITEIRDARVTRSLTAIAGHPAERPPLPDVVVPNLLDWMTEQGEILATSYSSYDMDVLPAELFSFLARLDGVATWREALGDEPGIDEALVRRMWDRQLLTVPDAGFKSGETSVSFHEGPWAKLPGLQESLRDAFATLPREPE